MNSKGFGIKLTEPLIGAEPKIALRIFQDAIHTVIGEAVLYGKRSKGFGFWVIFVEAASVCTDPKRAGAVFID